MRTTTPEFTIALTVGDRGSMERQLDQAVSAAKAEALIERRRDILVTRHGFESFSVALSDDVPFGETREHQDWRHGPKSPTRERPPTPSLSAQAFNALLAAELDDPPRIAQAGRHCRGPDANRSLQLYLIFTISVEGTGVPGPTYAKHLRGVPAISASSQ